MSDKNTSEISGIRPEFVDDALTSGGKIEDLMPISKPEKKLNITKAQEPEQKLVSVTEEEDIRDLAEIHENEQRSLDLQKEFAQPKEKQLIPSTPEKELSLQDIINSVSYARFYSMQQGVITGKRIDDKFVSKEDYRGNLRKDQIPAYDQDTRADEKIGEVFPKTKNYYGGVGPGELYLVAYGDNENLVIAGTGRTSIDFVRRPNLENFEFQFPLDKESEVNSLLGKITQDSGVLQPFLNGLFENNVYPKSSPTEMKSNSREARPTICSYPMTKDLKIQFKDLR